MLVQERRLDSCNHRSFTFIISCLSPTMQSCKSEISFYEIQSSFLLQGGSNMTGTDCV
jgi:hypothetical protein